MVKNKYTTYKVIKLYENNTSFFTVLTCVFISIKTTLISISRIIKSFTVDLPIAYANIRV